MKQFIITALIACCFVHIGFSQEFPTMKLNAYFDTLEQNDKFMGTVCVSRNGDDIYTKSVGFSNMEAKARAHQNSRYKIGSISKTFTAVMIFQAIEQGRLTLATTLDNYFPNIQNAESITIDHLLSHRSGIHNFTDNNFQSWATERKTRDELLKIIADGGSDFTPDSKTQYSNSNYVLLSWILENIYRQPFQEILQTNIITPLQLPRTSFGRSETDTVCHSYQYFDKWRIESDTDPSVTMGAGGIVSTASDLNLFFHALFSGKLISPNSLVQMTTVTDGYGRGLFRIPFRNRTGYGRTGGIDGFHSISIYFPDDQTAYSLTSNGANYIINNISIAVLSATYGVPFEIPDFTKVNYTSTDLDKYLGVYSSSQLPIKLTVSKRGKTLVAQGTGQSPFELKTSGEHIFRFDPANIILVFEPDKGTMILKQGGGTFFMKKDVE